MEHSVFDNNKRIARFMRIIAVLIELYVGVEWGVNERIVLTETESQIFLCTEQECELAEGCE